jgi:hypothetical protein
MALLKTVHHISHKLNEIISICCPVCGCSHMEADKKIDGFRYWTCQNGHYFYVSVYESSAKALNVALLWQNRVEEQ